MVNIVVRVSNESITRGTVSSKYPTALVRFKFVCVVPIAVGVTTDDKVNARVRCLRDVSDVRGDTAEEALLLFNVVEVRDVGNDTFSDTNDFVEFSRT